MILNKETLIELGCVTGELVEREVKFKINGEQKVVTVFIRPFSYKTAVDEIRAVKNGDDSVAARIAASICDENGKYVFTPEDINGGEHPENGFPYNLTMALLKVIGEVNSVKKGS